MDYYVPPRPWYRPRYRVLIFWILALLVMSSLYSYWSDARVAAARRQRELMTPQPGATCEVELEPPAQGSATSSPSVKGLFATMNDQWVVLDGVAEGDPQQWIPREQIVVLKVHGESR